MVTFIMFYFREYNELPENVKEVSTLEMRFRAVLNGDSPDISSIYVGDEFYMFIEYKGGRYCIFFFILY